VQTFASSREAKEFLISKIVEEAQRENISLSDTERKMLYFSETAWSLPNIYEVNEAFERNYSQPEYEAKIAILIRSFRTRNRKPTSQELASWNEALHAIEQEDHYLLVLIKIADGSLSSGDSESKSTRFLQLLGIGIAAFCVITISALAYLRWFASR
jgi:hypothetical protein